MSNQPTVPSGQNETIESFKSFCIDFGLPFVIILITGILLFMGKDTEIKTIFAAAAGWIFKSGYTRVKK